MLLAGKEPPNVGLAQGYVVQAIIAQFTPVGTASAFKGALKPRKTHKYMSNDNKDSVRGI